MSDWKYREEWRVDEVRFDLIEGNWEKTSEGHSWWGDDEKKARDWAARQKAKDNEAVRVEVTVARHMRPYR